ncbi:PulJ/GspJ family protein [Protaetiibacter intestinalis]|nr:prepilin-type N-terminal cleavage/methylation domain-containing protein [Protaetiibacter intestinalis]
MRWARLKREEGFSVIELIVAMLIFTIFAVMLSTTLIAFTRSTLTAQQTARTGEQMVVAFGALDSQIRYAESINFPGPGTTAGNVYVEWLTRAESSPTRQDLCTQWRYVPSSGVLEYRRWNLADSTTAPPWTLEVSGVVNTGASGYPFQLIPANDSPTGTLLQQLVVTISAGNANANALTGTRTSFVARNSSYTKSVSNAETSPGSGVSASPVCNPSWYRP